MLYKTFITISCCCILSYSEISMLDVDQILYVTANNCIQFTKQLDLSARRAYKIYNTELVMKEILISL